MTEHEVRPTEQTGLLRWHLCLMFLGLAWTTAAIAEPDLIRQYEDILAADQQYRSSESTYAGDDRWQKQEALDRDNVERVLSLVEQHGWPRISDVGEEAALAAFLVIQHADLSVQERFLPVIESLHRESEAKPVWVALLTDRIRVRSGKPQLYGTQFRLNENSGKTERFPIEDEARVNERRAALGLKEMAIRPLEK